MLWFLSPGWETCSRVRRFCRNGNRLVSMVWSLVRHSTVLDIRNSLSAFSPTMCWSSPTTHWRSDFSVFHGLTSRFWNLKTTRNYVRLLVYHLNLYLFSVVCNYHKSTIYASRLIGLTKTCPSSRHLGSSSDKNNVSLVPRLIAMSLSHRHRPANDAGLSPVNDTTRHSGLNPNLSA